MSGRRTFGGTAGGGRSGKRGDIEYVKVVPRFLQNMVESKDDYSPGTHMPNSMRRKENGPNFQGREEPPLSTADEIEQLRKDGFNVDIENVEQPEDSFVNSASERQAKTEEQKREKRELGVATARISKESSRKKPHAAFAVKNKSTLSFSVDSDSDSESSPENSDAPAKGKPS